MNERGVALLIGFILLFAIIMGFIGIVQSTWVPEWNKAVEAKHYEKVVEKFESLKKMVENCETGVKKVVIDASPEYPLRPFLVNPPSPASTLDSISANVTLNGEEYKTDVIVFRQYYNYLPQTTFVYEHSALFGIENSGLVELAEQSMYRDKKITLYVINASLNAMSTTSSVTLTIVPLSYGGETFYKKLNLTMESYSNTTASWWENEIESCGFNVTREGRILIINDTNVTVSVVYVGISNDPAIFSFPKPEKIVNMSKRNYDVYEGETLMLGAKVLNKYNNPVRNYPVNIIYQPASTNNQNKVIYTDENGVVKAYFNAENSGENRVIFSAGSARLEFTINVTPVNYGSCDFDLSWLDGETYEWHAEENDTRVFKVKLEMNGYAVSDAVLEFGVTNNSVVEIVETYEKTDQNGIAGLNLSAKNSGSVKLLAYYGGCSDELDLTVNITKIAPVAVFSYTPRYPAVGEMITFDASSSYDPDGSIVTYEWDFDGDGVTDANGVTATYSYSTWGSKTVELTVVDNEGLENTTSVQVYVGDLVYNNDAVAVDGPDSQGIKGGVEFTVTNRFNSPVTIDSITIDPLDDSINVIRDRMTGSGSPGYSEIFIEADTNSSVDFSQIYWWDEGLLGVYDGIGIPSNGLTADVNAVVNSGSTAKFYLYEFGKGNKILGNWWQKYQNVNMKNREIKMTIYYIVNGENKVKTFTITPS